MEMAGLSIFDVALNDVYGGSFRVFVKHKECKRYPESNRYRRILREERAAHPDYLLALPYGFVNSFLQREAPLIAQGARFIVPLPEVLVLPR